ncbi:hypothetical protein CA156_12230 [Vibrio parahaemolyticus]|nr:hypothetical protein CA156_12230 [Vibrio parahaemolyticus]
MFLLRNEPIIPLAILPSSLLRPIFIPKTSNAFYTANSGFSRTLPHSFLTKEKQILALTFMKQIEK